MKLSISLHQQNNLFLVLIGGLLFLAFFTIFIFLCRIKMRQRRYARRRVPDTRINHNFNATTNRISQTRVATIEMNNQSGSNFGLPSYDDAVNMKY